MATATPTAVTLTDDAYEEHRKIGLLEPEIDEDFEIVEHEQAHVVAMAAGGDPNLIYEEESVRMSPVGENNVEHFLDQFSGMINHENLKTILSDQDHMLTTLEVANEKLASLNNISERNYAAFSNEFRQQTQTLLVMKKQLDSCFRRIRHLKSKLATQYPQAYEAALKDHQKDFEEDDS